MNQMSFATWATDPARTVEEQYGALLLMESTARSVFWKKFKIVLEVEFYNGSIPRKQRSSDPGYIPKIDFGHAKWTEDVLADLTYLPLGRSDDRPLRDVSVLQFCPALEHLELSYTEVTDFKQVASLPRLKHLHITATEASDFTFLGRIETLERLYLTLFHPWPDLTGLERLPKLRDFTLNGNTLALGVVPRLANIRKARFDGHRYNVPIRSLAHLPEMPELIDLELASTVSLEGLQRYPQLTNLRLAGRYDDLSPLQDLRNLTHAHLASKASPDVTPLAELPSLCRVTFEMEMPPDLTPLSSSPRLHEILIEGSPIVPAELASLNSLCEPWDNEFLAETPRKLRKLEMRLQRDREVRWNESPAPCRDWSDDAEMAKSETRWFVRSFNRAMNRLLGKEWGPIDEKYPCSPGHLMAHINRLEDISRMPEIARIVRKLIASARYPWHCAFLIDSLATYRNDYTSLEDDNDDDWLIRAQKEENEREKEHHERLKRTYLHRLSLETGVPPPPLVEESRAPEEDEEDHGDGFFTEQPEYDLGTSLQLYATLNETHVYVSKRNREIAEDLFELKAEDDPLA